MVIVEALPSSAVVLLVTVGATVATWTAVPLLLPFVVTTAVKLPPVGFVENVTVRAVAVAEDTVPTAPLLKTTVLLLAVVSKPKPLIVTVETPNARLEVLAVTVGVTLAT